MAGSGEFSTLANQSKTEAKREMHERVTELRRIQAIPSLKVTVYYLLVRDPLLGLMQPTMQSYIVLTWASLKMRGPSIPSVSLKDS